MLDSHHQLLIHFGYDGQRFRGVQPQPGQPTAGGAVLERLRAGGAHDIKAVGFAARTDRGVHAVRNVMTVRVRAEGSVLDLCTRLGAIGSDGLFGVTAEVLPRRHHARGWAVGKRYVYRLVAEGDPDAWDPYAWVLALPLDVARMRVAARYLAGTHDFSSFRSPRCDAELSVKTLWGATVLGPWRRSQGGSHVTLIVEGAGFLRKMVRLLAGSLAAVGCGLREPQWLAECLRRPRVGQGGPCAPPHGLALLEVLGETSS